MSDVVSEVIRLNNDIARLAERAPADAIENAVKVRKANNWLNGLFKNVWISAIRGIDESDNPLLRYGSDSFARYALLGLSSLQYLSRRGFQQVIEFLARREPNGLVDAMSELAPDPIECIESVAPIVEQVDSKGFISFFALDAEKIKREYCGKIRTSSAFFAFLGAIINEMVIRGVQPETIRYPIVQLSAELAYNILNWRQQSAQLGYQLVEGNLGMGKSTYVFMSIMGMLRLIMGAPPVGWESRVAPLMYLRSTDDLVDVLEHFNDPYNRDLYIPLFVIEDASATLPKYWIWEGKEVVNKMKKIHELLVNLRGRFANLIVISNSLNDLASFIRNIAHVRYSSISMDVGLVRHTLFAHNISRSRNPLLWGWRSLKLMGSVVYPLNKLPREVYEADLAFKRGRMRQIAGELKANKSQGGGGEE